MIVQALAGITFVLSVSINSGVIAPDGLAAPAQMTVQEKRAVMRPIVHSATDCLSRAVAADPRIGKLRLTDIIVDSFKSCVEPVRALINAHDRYYGTGTGEQFFMGPYLDALPAAVSGFIADTSRPPRATDE
jgi:hypothetical protein